MHAHGGQLYQVSDGTFYWLGEGAKKGCDPPPYGQGCSPLSLEVSDGINLYSSADLRHWEFRSQLLDASALKDPFCGSQTCRVERPKVSTCLPCSQHVPALLLPAHLHIIISVFVRVNG